MMKTATATGFYNSRVILTPCFVRHDDKEQLLLCTSVPQRNMLEFAKMQKELQVVTTLC